VEQVLALAAVKRFADARKFMNLNLTPENFSRWRAEAPDRGGAITRERILQKIEHCIARYK
jgi:hypothetical protein